MFDFTGGRINVRKNKVSVLQFYCVKLCKTREKVSKFLKPLACETVGIFRFVINPQKHLIVSALLFG